MKELLYVESMKAFSAKFNTPLELLKVAKRQQCPGFSRSGRVYVSQVLNYLKDNEAQLKIALAEYTEDQDDLKYWQLKKLKASALTAERQLKLKQSQLWRKDETMILLDSVNKQMKSILKNKLTIELPARFVGKGSIDMLKEGSKILDEICDLISAIKI